MQIKAWLITFNYRNTTISTTTSSNYDLFKIYMSYLHWFLRSILNYIEEEEERASRWSWSACLKKNMSRRGGRRDLVEVVQQDLWE